MIGRLVWHREWSVSAHVILKPPIRSPPKRANFTWNVLGEPSDPLMYRVPRFAVLTQKMARNDRSPRPIPRVDLRSGTQPEQPVESETHSPAEGREEEYLVSNYSGSDGCE